MGSTPTPIPALLSKGALESLRGCLDFAQRTLTLGKTGKVIPLQMSEMGHYILSVADFPARVHSASLIQWTPLNQATQMMDLMCNGGFCWSEDPEPTPAASACKVADMREAGYMEDLDSNSGIGQLHLNWDPVLATRIKHVLGKEERDTWLPPRYVDGVVSPWDAHQALANVPSSQPLGTPKVPSFNERLRMDLLFPKDILALHTVERRIKLVSQMVGASPWFVDLPLAFEWELSKPLKIPTGNLAAPQAEVPRARVCLKVAQATDPPRYKGTVVMDPFWDSSREAPIGWMDPTMGLGEPVPLSIDLWVPVSPPAPHLAGLGTVLFERMGGDSVLTAGDSNRETCPRSMELVPDSRPKYEVSSRVALVNDKDAASKAWVAQISDRPGGPGISPDKERCFAWNATTAATWRIAPWGEFLVLSPVDSGIVAQDMVNTRWVLMGTDRAGEHTVSVGLVTRGPEDLVFGCGSCRHIELGSSPLPSPACNLVQSSQKLEDVEYGQHNCPLAIVSPLREFPLQDLSAWRPRAWCPSAPVYELNNAPVELDALFGRVPSWVMRNC